MERLFDADLIARRRARALRAPVDFLHRHAADQLADRLETVQRQFDTAIELDPFGVGVADRIAAIGKTGRWRQIALAGGTAKAPHETVPVEPDSIGLVVSVLGLHRVNDTPGVLVQIRRALVADGLFLAAIPATGTLFELRQSLIEAETELIGGASARVAPFADVRDYGGLLQRAGFALPVADAETLTVRYDTMFELIADLRGMGMTNPLVDRSRVPARRALFQRAAAIYQDRFADPDGRIRATFAIVYLSGWAPHESQQRPLKPGSAKTRLADALNTREMKLPRPADRDRQRR